MQHHRSRQHTADLNLLVENLLWCLRSCPVDVGSDKQDRGVRSDPPALPASAKPYILTLHVLYPHVLLDALNLLDRGFVYQLCVSQSQLEHGHNEIGRDDDPSATLRGAIVNEMEADDVLRASDDNEAEQSQSASAAHSDPESIKAVKTTYHVRSAQVPHQRQYAAGAEEDVRPSNTFYQVHLQAWHCSCPAFALALLTREPDSPSPPIERLPQDTATPPFTATSSGGLPFVFGGIPASRQRAAQTTRKASQTQALAPVCKHIMACALAAAAPNLFQSRTSEAQPGPNHDSTHDGDGNARGMVQKWVDTHEAAGWAVGAGNPDA